MKKQALALGMALALGGSLAATDAFAQASTGGFDALLSVNVPILKASMEAGSVTTELKDPFVGFGGTLGFGYRWTYIGAYLYQDLGGIWYTGDHAPDDGWFLGGTYLGVRGIFPVTDQFQLDLGYALGLMYTSGKEAGDVIDEDENNNLGLILNKKGKKVPAFAMKLSLAATYYITSMIGIGIQLDYNIGLHTRETEAGDIDYTYHQINPGILVRARF